MVGVVIWGIGDEGQGLRLSRGAGGRGCAPAGALVDALGTPSVMPLIERFVNAGQVSP